MQNNTLRVYLYELRRNFRRPGFLFTTFGIPLLLYFGFNLITAIAGNSVNMNDPESAQELMNTFQPDLLAPTGFVDLSGVFADVSLPSHWTRYASDEEARAAIASDEVKVVYEVDPTYMETGNVTVLLPELEISRLGDDTLAAIARDMFASGIDPAIAARLTSPATYTEQNLLLTSTDNGAVDEDASFLIVYAFALTLIMTIFMTNGYLMQTLIEEKETRLIEILVSSLRPIQLLAGKIVALGTLGLVQVTAWVGTMLLIVRFAGGQQAQNVSQAVTVIASLANIQLPTNLLPLLLVYFILSYLLFAGLYSIVSALSNSMREGPQYTVIFVLPAMAPLYFLPVFASSPDAPLAVVLSLFPLTAPIAMTARLVVSTVPAWEIAVSLGLLLVGVIAAIWVAARVFRAGVLLAGNMPKLKDIPMLMRG
ncbi:MAG: ABC transporter permease [Anaerolineae bacterium]